MNAPARLGRYEIVCRIGKSMTDVHLATDTVENRKVALKLIRHSEEPVTKLIIEAERRGAAIQKQLHAVDPRMVEIYEYGDVEGYFLVAMEFVEGRTVADMLAAEQVLNPYRAAIIAVELCEQLEKFHAPEAAVVHGDIKPSNIHLGLNDTVRLLDFGIAKTLRADCSATGHHFGSPSYCSPERLSRKEVAPQSDLWALGATLYEMLAGVPPYQAEDTRKLERLIQSKRPPRALHASCPAGLRAIVGKSLAADARSRYASADDFRADLQLFLEGKATLAETEARSRWNPSATVEAARKAIHRVTRTARQHRDSLRMAGATAYFVTGMLLWIGGSLAWDVWQTRASAAVPTVKKTPPVKQAQPEENLAQWYVASADRILDSYRTSPSPSLAEFDWQKAEICLARAVQLGVNDDRTAAKLALARGYATLERLNEAVYSETAAAGQKVKARDEFALAALKAPSDPAPHLALARVYVYSLPDAEKAMAEFAAAERLGALPGSREIEQQGDVYRIKARRELSHDWRQAKRDADIARALYRRISGFNETDRHLKELEQIHAPVRRSRARRSYRWR